MTDRPRWSRIPPEIARRPDLSDRAKVIYGVLRDRCDQDGYCWPKVVTIGRDIGRTERTARRGVEELVRAGVLERRPTWQTPDSPQLFDTPGDGRERTANRYRLLIGVGDSPVRKVGDTSVLKVEEGVADRAEDRTVLQRGDKEKGRQREILPTIFSNSNHPTSRAEEDKTLDAIIGAVREHRSDPLSRDQAREARKIARDRLRAGWPPQRVAEVLVETSAFTTAAVDFAASGAKRRGSTGAQRSTEVLARRIRGES
jgi:hypothetical protein